MNHIIKLILLIIVISFSSSFTRAQSEKKNLKVIKGSPVTYKGDTLFYIYGSLGPFSADFRAKQTTDKKVN